MEGFAYHPVPKRSRARSRGLVVGAIFGLMAFAGVALAVWTTQGQGFGSGRAANAPTAPTITAATEADIASVSTVDDYIYPGGKGDLYLKANNTSAAPMTLKALAFTNDATPSPLFATGGTSGGKKPNDVLNSSGVSIAATCLPDYFVLAPNSITGLSLTVPGSTTSVLTVADVVYLRSDAPNACQGAIPVFNGLGTGATWNLGSV